MWRLQHLSHKNTIEQAHKLLYSQVRPVGNKESVPQTNRKMFAPNVNKKRSREPPRVSSVERSIGPCTNELNIQLLSRSLYEQIFKKSSTKCDSKLIEQCKNALLKHGMVKKNSEFMKDVEFQLPKLEGANVEEHFQIIAQQIAKPHHDIIHKLLIEIPQIPKRWIMKPGWTRYAPNCNPEPVSCPLEDGFIFDVEVCVKVGKAPTLATAVSSEAWYAWISQSLIDGSSKPITNHYQYSEDVLIPFESETDLKKPKVIVGHNVSYDRSRIKEQYWLEQTGMRFVDTMSLHMCVSGVTSYQRALLKSGEGNIEDECWKVCSSLNSLTEVHKLYCGNEIEKETRNIFVEGSLSDIKGEFQKVMDYCARDVQATHNVLKVLFPLFLERFPHPATFAGMLEMGSAYLPVNSNWERYLDEAQQTYDDLDIEGRFILARRADQACQLLHDEKYKEDVWMWDQDWAVKEIKLRKLPKTKKGLENVPVPNLEENEEEHDELEEKFKYLKETHGYLSHVKTLLPGYPNWFRKLCTKPGSSPDWVPGPHLISTSMRVTPKLLNLTWEGYPLHYISGMGWGLLVPFSCDLNFEGKLPLKQLLEKCPLVSGKPVEGSVSDSLSKLDLSRKDYYSQLKPDKTNGLYKGAGVWCNEILEDSCFFFKLPHKDGPSNRVGNPLAKDFLNKFSENVLAGDTESAEKVLSIARMLSYWRNNRDRISEQMVVWLDDEKLPKHLRGEKFGAIVPQVVVCGTLTRRAMEPTWMTASNAHPERVGSELRAMVQAPPGYNIVGADVDSQELWIASIIGDAYCAKIHGATPFGWMTLSGNKADSTDMHSVTAKAVGMSRDHAKVINYARIYGAGQNFAERLLKQFNPTMSESEARNKAIKMFDLTKGKRIYYLQSAYLTDFPDQPYTHWDAFKIAKASGKPVSEMFKNPKWVGGTESAMFNRLEEIARDPSPITPFLSGRLSRALEPQILPGDRFLPTRINWVVQSGAVDFLHLMLVCMRWIMKDRARFCLSFHDEIRYLVPEEFKYKAALAMHVTNLLTRAFCASRLGMNDLPQSVAFFSSVEVDSVLRKEAKLDCKTPSNPHGLSKGYGIPTGESLDIYQAIEKADGRNKMWYYMDSHVKGHQKKARVNGNSPR